jgi:hypothetical protein
VVSKVDICNLALQNIGASSITTLTEDSVEANECNLRYDSIRKSILELHLWNFAIKRVSLNKEVASPAYGYDNQFTLPSDFIRMVATEEQDDYIGFPSGFNGYLTINNSADYMQADNYKIEISGTGTYVLLSNDADKKIRYVFDQEDVSKFPYLFVQLVAKGLSAAIAYRITGSKTTAAEELKEFEAMLMSAKTVDAQQGTFEKRVTSTFIGVR